MSRFLAFALFAVAATPASASPPSPFGRLTSARWAIGAEYVRAHLDPVPNPNPAPEPQPRRDHPIDVVVHPDGTRAYVTLAGSELEPGHEIAVVDLSAERVARRIPLRLAASDATPASSPYRIALHPDGRHLLITSRFSNFISIVDSVGDQVVAEIPTDFYGQGMAVTPDGETAYVANRYLDQVFEVGLEVSESRLTGALRIRGGVDAAAFERDVHPRLVERCGAGDGCHATVRGGFVAGEGTASSLHSVLEHIRPGDASGSRLLRAVRRTRDGGWADHEVVQKSHAGRTVVFAEPSADTDDQAIAGWIDTGGAGPGIPVGNPRSKPEAVALSPDGRHLFVGNTGTQDISIIDTEHRREVGGIYLQSPVNDLKVHVTAGRTLLLVTTLGLGFGVGRERDPYGAETWDENNPATHWSVWRDPKTAQVLPRAQQRTLGPFDAVDGTAAIKFRDIQNDLVVIDLGRLELPTTPPDPGVGLSYLLRPARYESHRAWVRYTSDTAESTWGDIKGDIPPELMRVVGATPDQMAIIGDRLYVTMQASNQVQALRIDPNPADPADYLVPERVFAVGARPMGIAAGPDGRLLVANSLGGTLSVIDPESGSVSEIVIDPSVVQHPVPATNAERGEFFAHLAVFSSDGDTSCAHCHVRDTGDGRAWGVSQVMAQQYLHPEDDVGELVIGGTMGVPQMRALFAIQPFFFEGVLSAFEPRSMIMEHCPADDFAGPTPQGDFTSLHATSDEDTGAADIQSAMSARAESQADLGARRDAFFRTQSMAYFGKAFVLRDFQRFVGEWQVHEPRLLPNPFDDEHPSVKRGEALFGQPQIGCISCHPPPHFAKKDLRNDPQQTFPPQTTLTARDAAFTLIGMNRLDAMDGTRRDLEPDDLGRAEAQQGHFTAAPLRGIWDRPPVFLHNGAARTLREVLSTPGHRALRTFAYEPLVGGEPERPGRREVGFNTTWLYKKAAPRYRAHAEAGGRLGFDTHGGTSHLTAMQIDDLVHFMEILE